MVVSLSVGSNLVSLIVHSVDFLSYQCICEDWMLSVSFTNIVIGVTLCGFHGYGMYKLWVHMNSCPVSNPITCGPDNPFCRRLTVVQDCAPPSYISKKIPSPESREVTIRSSKPEPSYVPKSVPSPEPRKITIESNRTKPELSYISLNTIVSTNLNFQSQHEESRF